MIAAYILSIAMIAPNGSPADSEQQLKNLAERQKYERDAKMAMAAAPNGYKLISTKCKKEVRPARPAKPSLKE